MTPPSVAVLTSSDAAAAIEGRKQGAQHRALLALLAAAPHGLTTQELADQSSLKENSVRPRMRELEALGYVFRPAFTTMARLERTGTAAERAAYRQKFLAAQWLRQPAGSRIASLVWYLKTPA